MTTALRVLLWLLVVIAPGGMLLLPILAADSVRRRKSAGLISDAAGRPSLTVVHSV